MSILRSSIFCILAYLPTSALSEPVHILDEKEGELYVTDQVLSDAALNAILGDNQQTFGAPYYVVRDAKTGEYTPLYTSAELSLIHI